MLRAVRVIGSSVAIVWLPWLAAAGCVTAPRFSGPLPVRNQHPAQLTVQHMRPAPATVLPAGEHRARFDAAYSSLFLNGIALGRSFVMDGEYLRFGPSLAVGLGRGLELSAELPFAHTTGGFLDSFLIEYHDVFGFPDQNRENVPNDRFHVLATQNGQSVWGVREGGVELLDVPLSLTWQLTDVAECGAGLAVRAGLELPTGDQDRGYGNGEVDWTAGLLFETHWRDVAFYGHAQHTFAGTPDNAAAGGLEFADVTSVGVAAELPLTRCLHAFTQVEFETSTLRNLDLRATEREQVLAWLGARWVVADRYGVELAFGEDLRGFVSPDFTAWIGFTTLAW